VSLPSEAGTEDWLTNLSRALILPTCGAKISLTKDEMSFRSSWENATAAVSARSHERTRRVRPARTTTTRARASPTPSSGSRGDRVHGGRRYALPVLASPTQLGRNLCSIGINREADTVRTIPIDLPLYVPEGDPARLHLTTTLYIEKT
jgi:hypothetical protein